VWYRRTFQRNVARVIVFDMKTYGFDKLKKSVALAGAWGILALGSISGFASTLTAGQYNLPGIIPSSLPAFETGVRVSYLTNSTGSTLKATFNNMSRLSNLVYPSQTFHVRNTKYTLNAVFDNNNVFQSGTVQIRGKIPGLVTDHGVQTLMSADLTAFASNTLGDLLGFNTANIVCHPDINVFTPCTTNESVYLALRHGIFDARQHYNHGDDEDGEKWKKAGKFRTSGIAITSIPVPAAVWLFGSGIVGLGALARRTRRIR
jgi:hypothetical protein